MLNLGEKAPLRNGGRQGRLVGRIEQALEHDPPVVDVAVLGEIDPAEATMGQTTGDFVLAPHQVARGQLRGERERRSALKAKALGSARSLLSTASDRCVA